MHTRKLGALEVSAIGLGCMSMSQAYGTADREESKKALHRALDIGYTFLDTASIYGVGHNETLIGETLKGRRNAFVLASKCGITVGENGRAVNCRPDFVKTTCEESLRRLQTDVIDLYYLHRKDPDVPIEESVGALADMVRAGKIRAIGLSEVSSTTLRRAHAEHPITAVQSEYSLWTRDPENKVLGTCAELGVGFVPFSPLGRAFLSGAMPEVEALESGDMRPGMPRFQGENLEKNRQLVRKLVELAAAHDCTAAQLSLAWVLHQGDTLVPIPGTKRVAFVEENAAAERLDLSEEVYAEAGRLINADTVSGERYAEAQMIALDPEV